MSPIHEVPLDGCRSRPLASYLAALGVFRLLAEQEDPDARAWWARGHLVLRSRLSAEKLTRFFLERYEPTPIAAPWNGGSGFYPKDRKVGIEALLGSTADRFRRYRTTLERMTALVEEGGYTATPGKDEKPGFVLRLRNRLADEDLAWLDAVLVLAADGMRFPPLLGTGGNDGRLDFSNNFMQRVTELFDPEDGRSAPLAGRWLRAALFAEPAVGLEGIPIGQFDPGDAGGVNASTGFEGGPLPNPWHFVLMLEGALAFAAATTRRAETQRTGFSYPFTVSGAGAGSGALAASDEGAATRAEMWLPLWDRPVSLAELRRVLSEGRITVGRRIARDGLEVARALGSLGVDRGLTAFERYAFLQRNGRAYFAAPLGRQPVRRNASADLLAELDRRDWLARLRRHARRQEAPARLRAAIRRLTDAVFELARRDSPLAVRAVLIELGRTHQVLARSWTVREAVEPLSRLSPRWLSASTGGGDHRELHLAVALAGLSMPGLPMRAHLLPVERGERSRPVWADSSKDFVWGPGGLLGNLARVARRRVLEAEAAGHDAPFGGRTGVSLGDLWTFLAAPDPGLDDRVARLLKGLVLVRIPPGWTPGGAAGDADREPVPFPAGAALLELAVLSPGEIERALVWAAGNRAALDDDRAAPGGDRARGSAPHRRLLELLAAGRTREAVDLARRRLRLAGATRFGTVPVAAPPVAAERLLASLLIPLRRGAVGRLVRVLLPPEEPGEAPSTSGPTPSPPVATVSPPAD